MNPGSKKYDFFAREFLTSRFGLVGEEVGEAGVFFVAYAFVPRNRNKFNRTMFKRISKNLTMKIDFR